MMEKFNSFTPDSFEQFVRITSLFVLGDGITVFGNGPDGGREATFRGKVPFPSETENWDGYGVIQAKYKEKTEGTQKDQDWAELQLEKELRSWVISLRRIPEPDYFIFVTNVDLSSANNGGIDRLEKVFKDFSDKLPMKDYRIWDAKSLNAFVTKYEELRKSYALFFTPSDLIYEMTQKFREDTDYSKILTSFLIKQLLNDEDAKLTQVGDRSENSTSISKVFIDLEVLPEGTNKVLRTMALKTIINVSEKILIPKFIYIRNDDTEDTNKHDIKNSAQFLLLGGPGSGKSTFGQFYAQIQRAALLFKKDIQLLPYNQQQIIKQIKQRTEHCNIPWPKSPRVPLVIELNEFAKELANQQNNTNNLFSYISLQIIPSEIIDQRSMLKLLKEGRWALILDGLDEVPASSNRKNVLREIRSFISDVRAENIDMFIISSSRHDGYEDELHDHLLTRMHLLELSPRIAENCAKQYIDAKHTGKSEAQAEKALKIIQDSIKHPLISKLMISPLQIAFMVTVVSVSGKPSESRWELFADYYRTIYDRELHKSVPPYGEALSNHRAEIDILHHQAGIILQYRGEKSGGTNSYFSDDEYFQLVSNCLANNGYEDTELENLVKCIAGASKMRLVFLTREMTNKVSFEVRSLQEFMAATHLTNADSEEIIKNLHAIAHSSYWRNTLLFAIGRFYTDAKLLRYRDLIRTFCQDCNERDNQHTKLGSKIALDILTHRLTQNIPSATKSLADCALRLIETPYYRNSNYPKKLSEIFSSTTEDKFKEWIKRCLTKSSITDTLPSWILIFHLTTDNNWKDQYIRDYWPSNPKDQIEIISSVGEQLGMISHPWLIEKLEECIPKISVNLFYQKIYPFVDYNSDNTKGFLARELYALDNDNRTIEVNIINFTSKSSIIRIANEEDIFSFRNLLNKIESDDLHSDWSFLCLFKNYFNNPIEEVLEESIKCARKFISTENFSLINLRNWLPWNLAHKIKDQTNRSDLSELERQNLWASTPLNFKKTLYEPNFDGLYENTYFATTNTKVEHSESLETLNIFNDYINSEADNLKSKREDLSWIMMGYLYYNDLFLHYEPLNLKENLLPFGKWKYNSIHLEPDQIKRNADSWIEFFNDFGNHHLKRFGPSRSTKKKNFVIWLLSEWVKDNNKTGLLRFAAAIANYKMLEDFEVDLPTINSLNEGRHKLALIHIKIMNISITDDEITYCIQHLDEIWNATNENCSTELFHDSIHDKILQNPLFVKLMKLIAQKRPDINSGEVEYRIDSHSSSLPCGLDKLPVINDINFS